MTITREVIDREAKRRAVRAALAKHGGPGDHAGGTPQSTHGRWARGSSSADIAEDTEEQGGATVSPATGKRPSKGFAVAIPDRGRKIPHAKATPARIGRYIRDNWDVLSRPGHFLGTWRDDSSGVVWLDVSKVIDADDYGQAFERAVRFGRKHNELAIYDLQSGTEIELTDEGVEAYRSQLGSSEEVAA